MMSQRSMTGNRCPAAPRFYLAQPIARLVIRGGPIPLLQGKKQRKTQISAVCGLEQRQ